MSRGVRVARNTMIGFAVFLGIAGVWMLVSDPTHWQDGFDAFGGASFCVYLVQAVNRDSRADNCAPER